jgi:hypothetical protein
MLNENLTPKERVPPKKYYVKVKLPKWIREARERYFKSHSKKSNSDLSAYEPAPGKKTLKEMKYNKIHRFKK